MVEDILDFTDDFDEIQKSFESLNLTEENALVHAAPKPPSFLNIYERVLTACKTHPKLGRSIANRENDSRLRCGSICKYEDIRLPY